MNHSHRCRNHVVARWIVTLGAAVGLVAGCTHPAAPPATSSKPLAPSLSPGTHSTLFYSKAGSLYISDPAGAPGRKLTDGPADTEPAPSPDLAHVAFIHKADNADYGGELWVLDLSPAHDPLGAPRRLVDPGALPPGFGTPEAGDGPPRVVHPRWSPTGNQIAFLEAGEGGGLLLVADATDGRTVPHRQRMFADDNYAWAPDGQHIAWTGGRSDVSPVDVSVLTVGATSTSVVKGANVFSVAYDVAGQSLWFSNGNASGELFDGIPFLLRDGGIYSVATPGGAPANPSVVPTSLVKGKSLYGDVAPLGSGAVAFTVASADGSSKSIQILDAHASAARTMVGNVPADSPGPVWGPGDLLAYVDAGKHLVVTDVNNRAPKQIDAGVDTFAWPPR
ncbi:hypothetical protein [Mycobacterium sp. TY815]|uniref:hypothetical protein n=1 Tax=Mycobacterium sp. TY815 TaxID=3050581 RepID=UPI0027417282|nr:hypothetical protein [Mycobacterium sp. TY815]MDP7701127.1 hypothetical protein [Mycobacterium sp. TY815]